MGMRHQFKIFDFSPKLNEMEKPAVQNNKNCFYFFNIKENLINIFQCRFFGIEEYFYYLNANFFSCVFP